MFETRFYSFGQILRASYVSTHTLVVVWHSG